MGAEGSCRGRHSSCLAPHAAHFLVWFSPTSSGALPLPRTLPAGHFFAQLKGEGLGEGMAPLYQATGSLPLWVSLEGTSVEVSLISCRPQQPWDNPSHLLPHPTLFTKAPGPHPRKHLEISHPHRNSHRPLPHPRGWQVGRGVTLWHPPRLLFGEGPQKVGPWIVHWAGP